MALCFRRDGGSRAPAARKPVLWSGLGFARQLAVTFGCVQHVDFKIRDYWANYIDEVCDLGGFLINGTDFAVVGKQNARRAPATKITTEYQCISVLWGAFCVPNSAVSGWCPVYNSS